MQDSILNTLNSDGLEVENISRYEDAVITITKSKFKPASEIDHIKDQDWAKGSVWLEIVCNIETDTKDKQNINFNGLAMKKDADRLKVYPRGVYQGKPYAASFVYDIISACKEYSEAQYTEFTNSKISAAIFVNKKFKMPVKFGEKKTGEEFIILKTDKVALKDENHQNEKKKEATVDSNDVLYDINDLPF